MNKTKNATQKPIAESLTIEDGQTQISLSIQNGFLLKTPKFQVEAEITTIINKVINGLPLSSLIYDTRRSLFAFAERQWQFLNQQSFLVPELKTFQQNYAKQNEVGINKTNLNVGYWNAPKYIRERVVPVMEKLAEMNALDPNDYSGKNALRNLAEMEVRYHNHRLSIEEKRESGKKLVRASWHGDCSDRCFDWQGKVYSLDGTSGKTQDGEKYEPLENATDVYYRTKAGKTYKNGLLGFNCRHKLLDYIPGTKPTMVTKEEQQRQYAINQKQRAMERDIRKLKTESELIRNIDRNKYAELKAKTKDLTANYKSFCKENEKAFYTERLQVLKPTNQAEREKYQKLYNLTNEPKPNKISVADEKLKETLALPKIEKGVVPKGATIEKVVIIAGKGTNKPIKDIQRLMDTHGGKYNDFEKKTGIVKGSFKNYEVHWYSKNGEAIEDEGKVKTVIPNEKNR